jgi:hypothetical protein
MAVRCHEASYVLADPFTNMLVFFMPGTMTSVNAFLDRIPKELQEQYITDYVTEVAKLNMADTNNSTDDGGIPYKYRSVVALARKL